MLKRLIPVAVLVSLIACGSGGTTAPTTPTPPPPAAPTVTTVTVSGSGCTSGNCSGQVGGTLQLTATAQLSDGSTQNVTAQAQWSSTNSNIASVSTSGLVSFRGAGAADITAVYQGKLGGVSLGLAPAGPRTSFGSGKYRVNSDIAAGRYFTDPVSGCYWERESGFGGSTAEIIANDFVGYNAAQIVVDIKTSDVGFQTDADCSTWNQTPRGGVQTSISPGMWLVNGQVTPGTYRANVSSGCYWERLRNFEGVLNSIIANDFVSSAGQQIVTISPGDVGFNTDGECGTWTRTTLVPLEDLALAQSPPMIEANWLAHRGTSGRLR
jgi:hypothetical protein